MNITMPDGRGPSQGRPERRFPRWLCALSLSALAGCASIDPQPSFERVAAEVAARNGQQILWAVDPEDQAAARALSDGELSLDNAVRLALISSPELQAQYQTLGIAEAALVQAGLLSNPVFDAAYREGHGDSTLDLHLSFDFLQVFLIPLRKRAAAAGQHQAEILVTRAVLARVGEVRQAWIAAVAARQRANYIADGQALLDSLGGVAEALWQAGNITRLERDKAQQRMLENRFLLDSAEAEAANSREHLAVVMGAWDLEWDLPDALPEVVEPEPSQQEYERQAVSRSLDLALARSRIETTAAELHLEDRSRLIPTLEAGWAAEREDGEWSDGPAVAFALPVLDTGKARAAGKNAQLEQFRREYLQLEIEVRAAARQSRRARVLKRAALDHVRGSVMPLAEALSKEATLQYFASQYGIDDVLETRMEQVRVHGVFVESLAAYWQAREHDSALLQGVMPRSPVLANRTAMPVSASEDKGGH